MRSSRPGNRTLAVVLAIAAVAAVGILVLRPTEPSADILAMDRFDRTVTEGWGESPRGGDYVISGTRANYSIARRTGVIVVPEAGITRSALLSAVTASDVELSFRVAMDSPVTGGGSFIYGILRHVDAQHEYRAKVRLAPDGSVYVGVTFVIGTEERDLSPEERVPDLAYVVGTSLDIRARVEGDPATIRVKVWPATQTEPTAWTMRANAGAGLLVAPGKIGVQVYVSQESTALPVAFTFKSLDARLLAAPGSSGSTDSQSPGDSARESPSP